MPSFRPSLRRAALIAIITVLSGIPALPSSVAAADVSAVTSTRDAGAIRYARGTSGASGGRVLIGDLGRIRDAAEAGRASRQVESAIDPEAIRAFLAASPDLAAGLDVDQALTLQSLVTSPLGTHVTFVERAGSRRVFGATATVHIAPSGAVFGAASTLVAVTNASLATANPAIDAASATISARAAAGVTPERLRDDEGREPELGVSSADGGRLAWRVVVPARDPYGEWAVLVDAMTGRPIGEPEPLFATAGQARVFVPNAVVATGDVNLRDSNNAASAVPEAAYSLVDLQGLNSSGFLTGPFVTTDRTSNRVSAANGDFTGLRRDDSGFTEVESYWAIDFAQRYIQNTLGITTAANYAIRVDSHAFSDDNSNYTRTGERFGVLNFGDGGVDDAQDAEIIWHEYGHALLDNMAAISFGGESGAIHEGWGDYVAATLSTTVPGDSRFHAAIGEWDATSYNPGNPPYLRRVDGTKQYPRDLIGEVHADGELYSACLWGIHESLGRDVANRILFNANFLLPSSPTMPDAAAAIIEADRQLNGGANASSIAAAFAAHGIVIESVPPAVTFVKLKKGKLTVDGSNFVTGTAVIEIDGTALGSLKYPKPFRSNGISTRITSKDSRVRGLTPGIAVTVTVLNPSTGLRSAPFSFTP